MRNLRTKGKNFKERRERANMFSAESKDEHKSRDAKHKSNEKNEAGKVSRRFSVEICHKSKHKLETNTFGSLFAWKRERGLDCSSFVEV
jgi:hypothetical protein